MIFIGECDKMTLTKENEKAWNQATSKSQKVKASDAKRKSIRPLASYERGIVFHKPNPYHLPKISL